MEKVDGKDHQTGVVLQPLQEVSDLLVGMAIIGGMAFAATGKERLGFIEGLRPTGLNALQLTDPQQFGYV